MREVLWLLGCTTVLALSMVFGVVVIVNGFISLIMNRKMSRLERDFWDTDELDRHRKR